MLKVKEIRQVLDSLNVAYDPKAKKPELMELLDKYAIEHEVTEKDLEENPELGVEIGETIYIPKEDAIDDELLEEQAESSDEPEEEQDEPEEVTPPSSKSLTVMSNLKHDGVVYKAGDEFDGPEEVKRQLLKVGVLK